MGNTGMQYQLAVMYRDGIGTEKNEEESKKWFSIYYNSSLSSYRIFAYDNMRQYPIESIIRPEDLIFKAAESYHPKATDILTEMLKGDSIISPEKEKAIQLYIEKSKFSVANKLYLANMYYEGILVEQDYKKAADIYFKNSYACSASIDYRLYMMYSKGLGFKQNKEEAMKYLKRSASRGNLDAKMELKRIGEQS